MRIRRTGHRPNARGLWTLIILTIGLAGGCSPRTELVDAIYIDSNQYEFAFDATLALTHEHGFTPSVRDRRGGVVATQPLIAPSVAEPWSHDAASLATRWENTLALRRRVVRFEFTPHIGEPSDGAPHASSETSLDLLGLYGQADLTRTSADMIGIRAWVFLEQAQRPGVRRSTWSRKLSSQARMVDPSHPNQVIPRQGWTVVGRDLAMELHLMKKLAETLELTQQTAVAQSE